MCKRLSKKQLPAEAASVPGTLVSGLEGWKAGKESSGRHCGRFFPRLFARKSVSRFAYSAAATSL